MAGEEITGSSQVAELEQREERIRVGGLDRPWTVIGCRR